MRSGLVCLLLLIVSACSEIPGAGVEGESEARSLEWHLARCQEQRGDIVYGDFMKCAEARRAKELERKKQEQEASQPGKQ